MTVNEMRSWDSGSPQCVTCMTKTSLEHSMTLRVPGGSGDVNATLAGFLSIGMGTAAAPTRANSS